MRWATAAAALGVWKGCVTLATMTAPSWSARTPALVSASSAAAQLMSMTDSSSRAQRRSSMPDRLRIHSSDESIHWQTSSLVTTRSGR